MPGLESYLPSAAPALGHDQRRCPVCRALGDAAIALAAEHGDPPLDETRIAEAAGLDPIDLVRHTGTAERCLDVAYDGLLRRLLQRFDEAFADAPTWEAGLFAGTVAELRETAGTPGATWLHYVGTVGETDAALRCARATHREDLGERLARARDAGPGTIGAELMVSVAYTTIRTRLLEDGDVRDARDVETLEHALATVLFQFVADDPPRR